MGFFNFFIDKKPEIVNAIFFALEREYQTFLAIKNLLKKDELRTISDIESFKELIDKKKKYIIVKNVHIRDVFKIAEYNSLTFYTKNDFDDNLQYTLPFTEICAWERDIYRFPKLKLSHRKNNDVIVEIELLDFEKFLEDLREDDIEDIYKKIASSINNEIININEMVHNKYIDKEKC